MSLAAFLFAGRAKGRDLMVVPAVGTPPVTPGTNGGDPNPAPGAGNEPSPGSGTPPQSAGDPGNPPAPGQSGNEPAGGGDPQNPPGNGNEPNPSSSQQQQPPAPKPAEQRLTLDEWTKQQEAIRRQLRDQEEETKAAELIEKAPVTARDLIDSLAEELEVRIPADLRKPLLELVDNLATTGTKGAERKWKASHDTLKETLDDISLAFYDALDTAAERGKLTTMVRDKGADAWVTAFLELKTPAITAKAAEGHATAQAALLPEGKVRDDFTAKVKGESDPKKIAQAFHDSLLGVVGPAGEPGVTARTARSGRPTLSEVTRRRAAGEYKTDAEFLADQDLALQNT